MLLPMHKFYLSVMNVEYSQIERICKISLKVFADDITETLERYHDTEIEFAAEGTLTATQDSLLSVYIKDKIRFTINDNVIPIQYIGAEADWESVWCYMQIEAADGVEEMKIYNTLMTEMYDTQKNMVHISVGREKKSLAYVKYLALQSVRFSKE